MTFTQEDLDAAVELAKAFEATDEGVIKGKEIARKVMANSSIHALIFGMIARPNLTEEQLLPMATKLGKPVADICNAAMMLEIMCRGILVGTLIKNQMSQGEA